MKKRTIFPFLAIIIIALMITFSGCSKSDEEDEEKDKQREQIKTTAAFYSNLNPCTASDDQCAISNGDDCKIGTVVPDPNDPATQGSNIAMSSSRCPTKQASPACNCGQGKLCKKTQESNWICTENTDDEEDQD